MNTMGQMEASEDHHLAGRRSRRHPAGYKSLCSESQRVVTLFPLPAAEPEGFLQVVGFFPPRLHFEDEMRCKPVGELKERNITCLPSTHPPLEIPLSLAQKEGTKCKPSTGGNGICSHSFCCRFTLSGQMTSWNAATLIL